MPLQLGTNLDWNFESLISFRQTQLGNALDPIETSKIPCINTPPFLLCRKKASIVIFFKTLMSLKSPYRVLRCNNKQKGTDTGGRSSSTIIIKIDYHIYPHCFMNQAGCQSFSRNTRNKIKAGKQKFSMVRSIIIIIIIILIRVTCPRLRKNVELKFERVLFPFNKLNLTIH